MKILFVHCNSNIQFNELDNVIELYDSRGSVFSVEGLSLFISSYSRDKPIGFYLLNNRLIKVFLASEARKGDSKLVEQSKIYFEPAVDFLSNKYGAQYGFFWSLVQKNSFGTLYSTHYKEQSSNTRFIVTVDTKSGVDKTAIWSREGMRNPQFINFDEGYDHQGVTLSRGDGELNLLWKYVNKDSEIQSDQSLRYEQFHKVVKLDSTVIVSLGSIRNERTSTVIVMYDDVEEEHTVPDPYFTDGHFFGLDAETGEKKWLTVFDYQVEDFVLLPNGKLCVSSERKLYIVDSETGVIEQEIDSGIRKTDKIETVSMTLLAYDDKLYLFSYKDCAFQIRDANTLELLREVEAREQKWHFAKYRPTIAGKLIFLPIELGDSELAGGAILVIDTSDIHAEIQIESAPEFMEVLPSKSSHGPIQLSVSDSDWAKVLRFLERRLLELVFICSGTPQYRYFEPRSINFTYSGFGESVDFITEKMEIFKERFERYLAEPHIPGVGISPVEFNYSLISKAS